jgi:hypothetical protein
VRLKKLASVAGGSGIGGFEWMEGIPGNVGGALRMNAGAMGVETFDQVVRVTFLDEDGVIRTRERDEIKSRVIPQRAGTPPELRAAGRLQGQADKTENIKQRWDESREKRKATQPVMASAGCTFKNPGGNSRRPLIDSLGLKGTTIGHAAVSEVHGNFVVNQGGATAKDILRLIDPSNRKPRTNAASNSKPKSRSSARTSRLFDINFEYVILQQNRSPDGRPGFRAAGFAGFRKRRAQGAAKPRAGRRRRGCHRHHHRPPARHRARVQRDPRHLRRGRPAPGALEDIGVPYTGAGVEAAAWPSTRTSPRPPSSPPECPRRARKSSMFPPARRCPSFPAPFVVKPPREGSSVGVNIVKDPGESRSRDGRRREVRQRHPRRGIHRGMELTVGILDDEALPIVHIIPPDGVYDMASKYPWLSGAKGSQYICPADLDEATTRAVQEAALAAHRSLGMEIYSRVDVLLDAQPPLRAGGQHHPRHDRNQPAAQSRRRRRHPISRTYA